MALNITGSCPVQDEWNIPEWFQAFSYFLFYGYCFYVVSTLAWMWTRRQHPHLRAREIHLVFISSLGGILEWVSVSYRYAYGKERFDCDWYLWVSMMVLPIGVGPMLSRLSILANRIKLQRKIAKADISDFKESIVKEFFGSSKTLFKSIFKGSSYEKMDDDGLPSTKKDQTNSIAVARSFTSKTYSYGITFIMCFVVLAIVLIRFYTSDNYRSGCVGCTIEFVEGMIFTGIAVAIGVLAVFSFVRLRGYKDPLKIVSELKYTLVFGSMFAAVGLGAGTFDVAAESDLMTALWGYLICVGFTICHTIQVPLQTYKTYVDHEEFKRRLKAGGATLEEVLRQQDSVRNLFERHCADEFNMENLYFYKEVTAWKEEFPGLSPAQRLAKAGHIYRIFLQRGAVLEVNIGAKEQEELTAVLDKVGGDAEALRLDLFDVVVKEVYELMNSGTYRRFLKSKAYLEYLEGLELGASVVSPKKFSVASNVTHSSFAPEDE